MLMGTVMVALCLSFQARAQTTFTEERVITLSPDSTIYLSEWVVEGSIRLSHNGSILEPELWKFDYLAGTLILEQQLLDQLPAGASINVSYRIYALNIPRTYQLQLPLKADSAFFNDPSSSQNLVNRSNTSTTSVSSDLTQSGSLSRGIIVGSNQDFALESGLYFELSGQLTDDIRINASLTDQNIPIQPDGTTQNLREFDKVYIQLEAPSAQLEMGDVDVSYQKSSFARLTRRLQGASGSIRTDEGSYKGAASVVRGTYKSIRIDGQEGVQGPYRLTGRNDQDFVIILAGTEKVYVNGQQVQRGAENDYIIDYGLGELNFTNNLLIKDETRITIEYEYVDQNFNRTLLAAEGGETFFDGKLQVGATIIRQADGYDLLSQQSLSREDIELLRDAGDDLEGSLVSGARIATEEERDDFVLYARVDTLYQGSVYSIYRHEPGSPEAVYRVQFSKVGDGEGAYSRSSGSVNGLLFEWVGPGRGNYRPFRKLSAPQKQQMVALNSRYQLSEQVEIFGEWAASDFDANRFSELDDGDNTDMAYEAGIKVNEALTALGKLDARVSRRYSGSNFQFFERTREVEFDRKWNINRTEKSEEAINEASFTIRPNNKSTIGADLGLVERSGYNGLRQASSISSRDNGILDLNYRQDWVQTEDEVLRLDGDWFRQQGSLSKTVGSVSVAFTPYLSFEHERRDERNTLTDSLSILSQSFYDIGPGLRIDAGPLELDASVAFREEKGVVGNALQEEARALEQRYRLTYEPTPLFSSQNEVRLRDKTYTDAFAALGNTDRQGLLIKSVTNYAVSNETFEGELFYQANTRRQALLQESYIETGPEIGQFVWDDLNGDGVQQVNEFFREVSPNEGTFIRQYLPSDELFPAIDLNVRLLNTVKPFRLGEMNSWLSEITLRSRIDIRENSTTDQLRDIYFLKLSSFRDDSTTIRGQIRWEKELDLLRGMDMADLRIGYTENRGLNQRSGEAVTVFTNRLYLNSAYELTSRMLITLAAESGSNRSTSSQFTNRNYDIHKLELNPGLNGTINRSWNAGFQFTFSMKEDRYPTVPVTATLWKISSSHRTYLWRKLQSNLRLELRNTSIKGQSSAFGAYELTEGTGEGTNLIWSLNNSYRASNLIRFSLNYDGRTVTGRSAVHIVKLVMSATF